MKAMAFIDTHCHLQDPRLAQDLVGVLERAKEAGVNGLVVCATSESDWEAVLGLAGQHAGIVPMLGLHPWYAKESRPGWEQRLKERLRVTGAGVGECGLDFAVEEFNPALQEQVFRTQVRLACELDRPISIHCRKAWERLAAITREEGLPAAGAVVHSFGGSAETARELQELGFYLSFSCSIANPANRKAAKVLPVVWPDRLLLESDAPDIPPRHLAGWDPEAINEPANIALVAEAAARLRGESLGTLAAQAYANSLKLFGRWLT
jgi:TatD DNase family protein